MGPPHSLYEQELFHRYRLISPRAADNKNVTYYVAYIQCVKKYQTNIEAAAIIK